MKDNLKQYRTSVCNINYHMVWSVKYRRKVLTPEVEKDFKEIPDCKISEGNIRKETVRAPSGDPEEAVE